MCCSDVAGSQGGGYVAVCMWDGCIIMVIRHII
jgi:hypothetical protein